MGKKSLIKSTSKKKATPKAKDEEKKSPAAKKAKSTAAKSAKSTKKTTKATKAPKATTAKTKAASTTKKTAPAKTTKKTAVKKSASAVKKSAPASKKAAPATKKASPKKKPTIKELLTRTYDASFTAVPAPPKAKMSAESMTAPALINADSEAETKRIRSLLFKTFSMKDLKAATEKAAAEKAAAEKAAAENAAAEKAAAEKATAGKTEAEPAPAASVSYTPPPPKKPADPVERTMKLMAAGLGLLIFLVVAASISNSGNYYLKDADGGLEIWQGRFAPLGEKHLLTLPGVPAPEEIQEVYTQKDVFPLAFNYYLDKADTLLEADGLPDFEGIKAYAAQAEAFAVDRDMRALAKMRSDKIDWMILVYKADMALARGKLDDLEAAQDYLAEADRISADPLDEDIIANKLAEVEAATVAEEARLEEEAAAAAAAEEEAAAAEAEAVAEETAAEQAVAEQGEDKAKSDSEVAEAGEEETAAEEEGH